MTPRRLLELAGLLVYGGLTGCAPVCMGTDGSCLDLSLAGSGSYASVSVWMSGSDLAGNPLAAAGVSTASGLPDHILVQPPAYLHSITRVSAQALDASQAMQLTGAVGVSWSDGDHIAATITLMPPGLSFGEELDLQVCTHPRAVAVLDADHNGSPDLAVVCAGDMSTNPGQIALLPGKGDGTFEPLQPISQALAGAYLSGVATANLNGDAFPDLAFTDNTNGNVNILLGKGDGTFQAAAPFSAGITRPVAIAAQDLNGDNAVDLAIESDYGSVAVLWNDGGGTFSKNTVLYASTSSTSLQVNQGAVAAADVNLDGRPDVIASSTDGNNTVTIWFGNSSGGFGPRHLFDAGSSPPTSVLVADINGDTLPDIVTDNHSVTGKVSILIGDGRGGFATPAASTVGSAISSVAVADLNGDIVPDFVISNSNGAGALASSGILATALGNGAGALQDISCPLANCNTTLGSIFVATPDLNADKRPDLVLVNYGNASGNSGNLSILLNTVP